LNHKKNHAQAMKDEDVCVFHPFALFLQFLNHHWILVFISLLGCCVNFCEFSQFLREFRPIMFIQNEIRSLSWKFLCEMISLAQFGKRSLSELLKSWASPWDRDFLACGFDLSRISHSSWWKMLSSLSNVVRSL
jgi:hypothetical protein